jgi:hypothetical protein
MKLSTVGNGPQLKSVPTEKTENIVWTHRHKLRAIREGAYRNYAHLEKARYEIMRRRRRCPVKISALGEEA